MARVALYLVSLLEKITDWTIYHFQNIKEFHNYFLFIQSTIHSHDNEFNIDSQLFDSMES